MATYQEEFDELGAALEDLRDTILVVAAEECLKIYISVLNMRSKSK